MKKKMTSVPFSGTPEQEARLRKELKEIAKMDGCAMPALQKAQEIYGYLPMEVQKMVSEETGIPLEKIFGITTFYSQFALAPNGKFPIGKSSTRSPRRWVSAAATAPRTESFLSRRRAA